MSEYFSVKEAAALLKALSQRVDKNLKPRVPQGFAGCFCQRLKCCGKTQSKPVLVRVLDKASTRSFNALN